LYVRRGSIKFDLKDYQGAISDFTEAIEIYPKDAHAYTIRGEAKKSLEDHEGAESDFQKAKEFGTNHD